MNRAISSPVEESKDPAQIEAMFSRIAPRYDIVNRLLSAGRDMAWRRLAISMADPSPDARVLDLGCGTADMISVLLKRPGFKGRAVGVDLSKSMLELGEKKLSRVKTEGTYELHQADALNLDYPDASFDMAMATFAVRNLADLDRGFAEMCRLLKPGGKFLVTEFFALNHEPWFMKLYLRYILPFFGGLVSGWRFAYIYLERSKEQFGTADSFIERAKKQGLELAARKELTFGVAEIILLEKAERNG